MKKSKTKQVMKRVAALSMAVVMSQGMMVGAEEGNTSLFNTNGTLPIVNEEITLKVLTLEESNHPTGHNYTSKLFDYLTEQTGIKFEIEAYTAEEMTQKLPLIMASNELPDIFLRCNLTSGELLSYGEQGILLAMDDLIEEYGYYTKQIFETYDDAERSFKSVDGHIYGLPRVYLDNPNGSTNINKRWLDNLGLEMPETLEELYDVLVAFKEQDANGNGDPDDEIPMGLGSLQSMGFKNASMQWVGINQYWPITGARFDVDEDGKVFLTPTSDNYRYLMEMLHKFYAEGLLDNECLTQTADEYAAKKEADIYGVASSWTDKEKEVANVDEQYLFLTSAVNDEYFYSSGGHYNPGLFAISASTEYPEICYLLGDYIYSEDISWKSLYGVEGEDYEIDAETGKMVANSNGNMYTLYINAWVRDEWLQEGKTVDEEKGAVWQKQLDSYKFAFQNSIPYSVEETDTISELGTDIGAVIDEYYVQFITGDKSLDDDSWNAYVDLVNSLGAEELTAVYQQAYDRYMSM